MIEIFNEFFINNGLSALFVLMFLNTVILTPPSEIILPLSGFLVYTSQHSLFTVIVVSVIANFLGTYVWYSAGRIIGADWVFKINYFKKRITKDSFDKICKQFHNKKAYWVGVFRFFPLLRALISLPAGMVKMPHKVFAFYTLIGMVVWNIFWVLCGYYLGVSYLKYSKYITLLLGGIMILVLLIFKIKIELYLKETGLLKRT
ncbi:MAG: DedA family protein [archaeon]